jgi:hypothetical protein
VPIIVLSETKKTFCFGFLRQSLRASRASEPRGSLTPANGHEAEVGVRPLRARNGLLHRERISHQLTTDLRSGHGALRFSEAFFERAVTYSPSRQARSLVDQPWYPGRRFRYKRSRVNGSLSAAQDQTPAQDVSAWFTGHFNCKSPHRFIRYFRPGAERELLRIHAPDCYLLAKAAAARGELV